MSKNDLKDKILSNIKIHKETKCWEWQRGKNGNGYGAIWREGKVYGAHRISYEAFKEPIPKGLVVRHTCDNPPCCNPDHLIVGTQADNIRDKVERNEEKILLLQKLLRKEAGLLC